MCQNMWGTRKEKGFDSKFRVSEKVKGCESLGRDKGNNYKSSPKITELVNYSQALVICYENFDN